MHTIDSLPEELQVHILNFLDSQAPSQRNIRDEPSLTLTSSSDRPLKNTSLLSKRWRRLTLPLLFAYTRLQLDQLPRSQWQECHICNQKALSGHKFFNGNTNSRNDIDRYHVDMVEAALERCNLDLLAGQTDDEAQQMGQMAFAEKERLQPSTALSWIPRFYHGLKDFIAFLQDHDLTSISMQSFVLYTDRMLKEKLHRFPHEAAGRDWRFAASAAFWAHFLSVLNPRTITIVAPPTDLACLANCAIDTFGDWAFSDMDFHILSLTQDTHRLLVTTTPRTLSYTSLHPSPPSYPSFAPSTLLSLRPWTSLHLNEGSFLKAYGTYEFFERGPPSLITSLKTSICNPSTRPLLPALTTFAYTAIFPFAGHANFTPLLHHIDTLSLQLAPDPQTGILSDKGRTGKAELSDCWQELNTAYADLAVPLRTSYTTKHIHDEPLFLQTEGREGATYFVSTLDPEVRVKRLEVRDFAIRGVRKELCDAFAWLNNEHWVKQKEVGVFAKQWEGVKERGRLEWEGPEVGPEWCWGGGSY